MKQLDNKNFQEVLLAYINSLPGLPIAARLDYFNPTEDDLVINAIGGTVDKVYMDGTREVTLNFEIACKSKNNHRASDTIWAVNAALMGYDLSLPSTDDSYMFLDLNVEKPGINGKDEQEYFVYTFSLQAKLEIGE